MSLSRRTFNSIGVTAPLLGAVAPYFNFELQTEPQRMIRCIVYAIRKEWLQARDWTAIYDELSAFSANEFYRNNSESSDRMKLIDGVIAAEMDKPDPMRIQISLDEDGEIGWSIVPDGFPGKPIKMEVGRTVSVWL